MCDTKEKKEMDRLLKQAQKPPLAASDHLLDVDCLTNLSDGSDDWLANIASIADDENFNDLPDAADL